MERLEELFCLESGRGPSYPLSRIREMVHSCFCACCFPGMAFRCPDALWNIGSMHSCVDLETVFETLYESK